MRRPAATGRSIWLPHRRTRHRRISAARHSTILPPWWPIRAIWSRPSRPIPTTHNAGSPCSRNTARAKPRCPTRQRSSPAQFRKLAAPAASDEEMTMSKEASNEDEANAGGTFGAKAHERPVPRISIEAFCEFQDTTVALQRAAADRRLSKADVGIHSGGIAEAVSFFGKSQTANLLIVETRGQGKAVLLELEQLANVCDESTKVIVVGRVNDVHLYRELVRRGVSEY